jgi:hypothetical protein
MRAAQHLVTVASLNKLPQPYAIRGTSRHAKTHWMRIEVL